MILKFINLNTNKFHNELVSNNINPQLLESKDNYAVITISDNTPQTTIDQINYLASIHDPTPLPPQPTEEDYLLDLDFRISMIELGL